MRTRTTLIKFGIFAVVMAMLTAFLFFIFGQYRTGTTTGYSAVFTDVSRLKPGQSVRVAGIRVGTVNSVSLQPDKKVVVKFDADRTVVLTEGTRAAVRYLNLVGDRYLELVDGRARPSTCRGRSDPGQPHRAGARPRSAARRTQTRYPGPECARRQCAHLRIAAGLPGAGRDARFAVHQDDLLFERLGRQRSNRAATDRQPQHRDRHGFQDGKQFSGAIDRLEQLVSGLSNDRDTIGSAIDALDKGTASLADLLSSARPPLSGTIAQLNRLAPILDGDKDRIDAAIGKAPQNYRKLVRLGVNGATIPYYLCQFGLRGTDLNGKTVRANIYRSDAGRCTEP